MHHAVCTAYEYCCVVIAFVFVLSSFGGLILDKTVSDPNFEGMAIFTPVINGKQVSKMKRCHM